MRERGFTLVEVLVALLILGIVITTTLAVFLERTRRLQMANETVLAYQALANEAEVRRRIDFSKLDSSEKNFLSDTTILAPLTPFTATVETDDATATVKNVTLSIAWKGGKRVARLALIRVDTGGTNLW